MAQDSDHSHSLPSIFELLALSNQVTVQRQIPADNIECRLLPEGVSMTWLHPKCLRSLYTRLSMLLAFVSAGKKYDTIMSLTRFQIHPPRITGRTIVVQDFGGNISTRRNGVKFPPVVASEFCFCWYSSALNRPKLAVDLDPTLWMPTFLSMIENAPGINCLPDGQVSMVLYRSWCAGSRRSNASPQCVP